jgi:hypothetical protein
MYNLLLPTMTHPIQDSLFAAIEQKNISGLRLVETVCSVLDISRSHAYKKIKGEAGLSFDEAMLLANYYDISLDEIGNASQKGKAIMRYNQPQEGIDAQLFMQGLAQQAAAIEQMKSPKIWYATHELPVFHYMPCKQLLAFKLYVWSRINWRTPFALKNKFHPEGFMEQYPEIHALAERLWQFYLTMPGKEFWPLGILDTTLRQIKYMQDASYFAAPDIAENLCSELMDMLHERKIMALQGYKTPISGAKQKVEFQLFHNEIAYTNSLILLFEDDSPLALFTTLDNPNFIHSLDKPLCQRVHHWLLNIEASSLLISNGAEKEREYFFNQLTETVMAI